MSCPVPLGHRLLLCGMAPTYNQIHPGQDAVSYLIVPTQPFQIDECTPGRARFYGPVLLDGAFQKRLEQKVQVAAAPNAVPQKRMRSLYLLVWEKQIKPHFDDSAKKYTEDILVSRAGQRVNLRSSSISVAFTGHQLAIPSYILSVPHLC